MLVFVIGVGNFTPYGRGSGLGDLNKLPRNHGEARYQETAPFIVVYSSG